MKILVIDREELSYNLLKARLETVGHQVTYFPLKSEGSLELGRADYDIVLIDPSPQMNAKPMVVNIRRNIRYYPYMILMSETLNKDGALAAGFNDFLPKPLDLADLDAKVENADTFLSAVRHLRDDSEDFPSAGGVIAKSAFNQLFLSCIDRADRYGEVTYVLFIGLKNYKQLLVQAGEYEAQIAAAKMAQHIVRLRRASDIIGQVSANEYALLLLRPIDEREPVEAAGRFADSLSKCADIMSKPNMDVEITVSLMEIPSGQKIISHNVSLKS